MNEWILVYGIGLIVSSFPMWMIICANIGQLSSTSDRAKLILFFIVALGLYPLTWAAFAYIVFIIISKRGHTS